MLVQEVLFKLLKGMSQLTESPIRLMVQLKTCPAKIDWLSTGIWYPDNSGALTKARVAIWVPVGVVVNGPMHRISHGTVPTTKLQTVSSTTSIARTHQYYSQPG